MDIIQIVESEEDRKEFIKELYEIMGREEGLRFLSSLGKEAKKIMGQWDMEDELHRIEESLEILNRLDVPVDKILKSGKVACKVTSNPGEWEF